MWIVGQVKTPPKMGIKILSDKLTKLRLYIGSIENMADYPLYNYPRVVASSHFLRNFEIQSMAQNNRDYRAFERLKN
jgi:hypothetical protein